MAKLRFQREPLSNNIRIEAEINHSDDAGRIMDAIKERVVNRLADKYVEAYGDEILSSLDLAAIKAKTNETVTIKALKELSK